MKEFKKINYFFLLPMSIFMTLFITYLIYIETWCFSKIVFLIMYGFWLAMYNWFVQICLLKCLNLDINTGGIKNER